MTRPVTPLLTLLSFLAMPALAFAFGDGLSGVSVSGCGACHVDAGDGIEVTLDCPSAVAPGQTVECSVSVNGSPTGGGGFNASATSGILSAGLSSQILAGEVTQTGAAARNWSFFWQAPDMSTEAMIRVAGLGANADGAVTGDDWDLATRTITVTEGGDTDGDGTADADDCAPTDPAIFPGAGERCDNGIDDDCDGAVDNGDSDCNPLLVVLGDVAPRGAPDGFVDVGDVILILRFASHLETPTADELALADVGPGTVSDDGVAPPFFIPTPDGEIDVADVVVALRQSVSLVRVICRPLPTAAISSDSSDHVPTGSEVILSSSASTEVEHRIWSLSTPADSLATLSSTSAVSPSFTPDVEGTYTATLDVGNCAGNATASLSRTASSVYSAGTVDSSNYDADSTGIGLRILSGRRQFTANLGATDCTLSDGDSFGVGVGGATYHWEQVGGPPVELSDPSAMNPTFTAPTVADIVASRDSDRWGVAGLQYHELELIFELTVSAGGQNDISEINVYLEYGGYELPARGPFFNVALNSRVWLEGASEEDDGDEISDWQWSIAGPAGDENPVIEGNGTRAPSFVPLAEGIYEVSYEVGAVELLGDGAPDDSGSFLVTSASFVGGGQGDDARPACAACHDGSVMPDIVTDFFESAHGGKEFAFQVSVPFFSAKSTASAAMIGAGPNPAAYELANPSYCFRCHTGWNPTADNGGLDDVLVQTGFEVPPGGIAWPDVISDFPTVASLAGQQCEVCHGPGSQHDGNLNANAIDHGSLDSMVCGQCHADQTQEWLSNSGHYQSYRRDSTSCFPCHAGESFVEFADTGANPSQAYGLDRDDLSDISCAVCHDPHSAENPHQLRVFGEVTMATGEVFDRGAGATCLVCHDGRYSDPDYEAVAHGAHGNTQGPVLLGVSYASAFRDGLELDPEGFSFHGWDQFVLGNFVDGGSETNDACVTCHMAASPSLGEGAFRKIGGHTQRTVSRDVLGILTDSDDDGVADLFGGSTVVTVAGADFTADFAGLGEDSVLELIITEADSALGTHRILSYTDTTLTLALPLDIDDDDSVPFVATEWRVEEVESFDNLSACAPCHAGLTDFNRMSRADYDGDGVVEGVQTEVRGLLDVLGQMIVLIDDVDDEYPDEVTEERCDPDDDTGLTYPQPGRVPSPTVWVDGSNVGVSRRADFCLSSDDVLLAAYNWNLVSRDGSLGVHNTGFAVQLLQRSYTALRAVYPEIDDPRSPHDDDSHTSFADAYPMATIR